MNKPYKSITYNVPKEYIANNYITITPRQLAGLYEPHTDIVEKLLEYSELAEANALLSKFKLDSQK